jgi:hypothetical protein
MVPQSMRLRPYINDIVGSVRVASTVESDPAVHVA